MLYNKLKLQLFAGPVNPEDRASWFPAATEVRDKVEWRIISPGSHLDFGKINIFQAQSCAADAVRLDLG